MPKYTVTWTEKRIYNTGGWEETLWRCSTEIEAPDKATAIEEAKALHAYEYEAEFLETLNEEQETADYVETRDKEDFEAETKEQDSCTKSKPLE